MLAQLVRFGVTGVGVTLFYSIVYWPIATYGYRLVPIEGSHGHGGAIWPLLAGVIAFVAATGVGKVAHSRISFKDHGTRSPGTAHRFLVVQLLGFGLNQLFIWLLTGPLIHGPTWWPLVPAVFVTPLVTFGLQRNWVFA
ncbi:GtrA family protein [uncultured Sphingomonas sp.]|uniref:GtrA family protein n=1 Tax=uncultured Sphingomonas sp. TaxID=158754 RepID=UPI0035CAA73A